MVKKTLGYTELEWKCPRCGTMNPGPQKECSSCGAQQPKKVEFQQKAEETLITDEQEIAKAQAGPNVHCAFCGARNPANAEKCTQCGANLGSATARESGQVLGAHKDKPAPEVACPQCGTMNPATASKCTQCNASLKRPKTFQPKAASKPKTTTRTKLSPVVIIVAALFALIACSACVLIGMSMMTRESIVGTVEAVAWEHSIIIEGLRDVTKETWQDDIPSGAQVGSCRKKKHHTQDNPAPGAKEVCGTPYTIDTGTGHGQVVQDCEYEVYENWCSYTVQEWTRIDTVTNSGNDHNPTWPAVHLGPSEREGDSSANYQVYFKTEKKTYTYRTSDLNTWQQYQVGTRWTLEINALGNIKSVERAQ